ncbi:hypothetical protein cyc_04586 [Cyclospora cayetanensis]|uniref:Uncharacterized protein n=1 Tax=Cyclospora cayetanensis TaxID=88456 RepID=A0A1D3DAU3_9EIME|nr:hypothetical protein cyc_04586 [Cyclospora cayetanensis]
MIISGGLNILIHALLPVHPYVLYGRRSSDTVDEEEARFHEYAAPEAHRAPLDEAFRRRCSGHPVGLDEIFRGNQRSMYLSFRHPFLDGARAHDEARRSAALSADGGPLPRRDNHEGMGVFCARSCLFWV